MVAVATRAAELAEIDAGAAARDVCAHCDLPLGRYPVHGTVGGVRQACCCYGCLLALQVTRARGDDGAAAAIMVRLGLAIFFAMNVMMVSMPTYAPVVYGGGAADGPLFGVLRVLAMTFAAPVLILLGWPIAAAAWEGARGGRPTADLLIVVATLAAYALSIANTLAGRSAVYFDTAAMLLVLVTLGRYLEARAKADAGAAVRAGLAPVPAQTTRHVAGRWEPIAVAAVAAGDVLRVGPGDAFPTDGVVVAGEGGVDEASLTGESRAVAKAPGSAVASGTCSIDAVFHVRATAAAAASAAARIADLLAHARRERSAAERAADAAARVLVPVVALVAIGAGLWPALHGDVDAGVLRALAVLVVSCPCALGIATPIALWTGLVTAARRGVVVRAAPVLERAAAIDRMLVDKTGTLTERQPQIVAIEPVAGAGEDALLAYAAALETGLAHPIARAVVAAWDARHARSSTHAAPPQARDVRIVLGGVRGVVDGVPCAIGDARVLRFASDVAPPRHVAAPTIATAQDRTAGDAGDEEGMRREAGGERVIVVVDGCVHGVLRCAETPRSEAAAALRALRRLGIDVALVSGDRSADAVVPALVPAANATLGLTPAAKLLHVRAARRDGRGVAMLGDGINDGPALAAADVGIAVAGATDLARITADVVLVADDLRRLPWFFAHARRVRRVVRQNLCWAFGYNAIAVVLAAAGLLTPVLASAAMLASSLAVVGNARRLRA